MFNDLITKLSKENVEQWIEENYGEGLKMDKLDHTAILSDDCKMISLYAGLNPVSQFYGEMCGCFEYNGRFLLFTFHIHEPNQKYANLSNKMTDVKEIVLKRRHNISFIDTDGQILFGLKAFWDFTPDNALDGEDLVLRKLMRSVTTFSRANQFCQKLRKTDKQYLKNIKG